MSRIDEVWAVLKTLNLNASFFSSSSVLVKIPIHNFIKAATSVLYSTTRDDLLNWRFTKDNSEELRTADDSISEESNRSLWARCQLSSSVGPRTRWHWSAERPAKTREFLWQGRAPSREQLVTSKAAAFVMTQSLATKHECIFVVGSWKVLLVI